MNHFAVLHVALADPLLPRCRGPRQAPVHRPIRRLFADFFATILRYLVYRTVTQQSYARIN